MSGDRIVKVGSLECTKDTVFMHALSAWIPAEGPVRDLADPLFTILAALPWAARTTLSGVTLTSDKPLSTVMKTSGAGGSGLSRRSHHTHGHSGERRSEP